MLQPETRYAKLGDERIAYQVMGVGPVDIFFTAGSFTQVDILWEDPDAAHLLRRLAQFSRLVLFDRRGSGASDALPPGAPRSWEAWADDLRSVADAAEAEQPVIVGSVDGGTMALFFAATYPDRVSRLIVMHATARMLAADDYPAGMSREEGEHRVRLVEEHWGTDEFSRINYPDRADDERFIRWYSRFARAALSPKAAADVSRQWMEADARSILGSVRAPTLVLHRTGYMYIPVAQGRYLAEHVPDGRFVELPGRGSMIGGDVEPLADIIEEFVTGTAAAAPRQRMLATVLFTDIVDSTKRAATAGDRQWKETLERHNAIVLHEVERYRGRLIKFTGDGALAVFDGPGRAVRGAVAIRDALGAVGLNIRAGLHTGEVEILPGSDVGGIAVHMSSRISSLASGGEVLASSTVRDLVVGAGIEFEDRGWCELKGVPGEWRLFAVAEVRG